LRDFGKKIKINHIRLGEILFEKVARENSYARIIKKTRFYNQIGQRGDLKTNELTGEKTADLFKNSARAATEIVESFFIFPVNFLSQDCPDTTRRGERRNDKIEVGKKCAREEKNKEKKDD